MPRAMSIELLVLNFNGRALLAECLPSILAAAGRSSHACTVTVIDNASSDDSLDWLNAHHPTVRTVRCQNRGLCSYNEVAAASTASVSILLNNDVKLAAGAIDPLVAPLLKDSSEYDRDCFLTAPRCFRFDAITHEGEKTAVRWRWGLVQGTAFFPGHEQVIDQADWTAAAGCVMAVSREKFLALGGFDSVYLPGRLEDLDLGYRGYLQGWHAHYVPESIAYHRGAASFGAEFGESGCDALALRNTLLFGWKNLRRPAHRARMTVGIAARVARDVLRSPLLPPVDRFSFCRALRDAWRKRDEIQQQKTDIRREQDFFTRFQPRRLAQCAPEVAR